MKLESKLGFDQIRRIIADRCMTEYAAARVEEEQFSADPDIIRHRLALTDEMRLILMFEDSFPGSGYIDAIQFLRPLEQPGYSLDVLSLGKLGTLLSTTGRVLHFFAGIKDGVYPLLKGMCRPISSFPEVRRRLDEILDRYGEIKDSASPELADIRKSIREKENTVSRRATAILHKLQEAGIVDADAAVVIRDGKFLIPVSTERKRKVPGYVMGESASGKTTFVEPSEIIELENDISELHFAERREISRILREFSDFLRPYGPDLIAGAAFLGELDFLMAKAHTALDFVAGMPVISEGRELLLRKARHPLLERALRKEGREIVPLSVSLDPGHRILLISGPNAGGKSVCLKTVGLLQYMFQWGMLIPTSESSELPVFDRIMVSIGDDQSLENDLSTYSSFLADMRDVLHEADGRTLVLIDEFGSGTEPAAGGAIAEAILAELDSRGVYGVITTHYTNLKLFAATAGSGVVNGAMLFDADRLEPLFRMETGLPGNSYAFELARKMKLPEPIVKDAETRAGTEYVGMEKNLRRIEKGRRAIEGRLEKVKAADRTLESLTRKYQKELEDIKQQKQSILDDARREAEEIVKGAGRQVEKTIRDIRESQADKEQTRKAREELRGFIGALEQKKKEQARDSRDEYIERKLAKLQARRGAGPEAPAPKKEEPLKVGEKVRVKENGMVGEVSKVSSKAVTVIIGSISSTMSPSRLERISSNEFREASRKTMPARLQMSDPAVTERKMKFSPELDIRGERLADALDIVLHYVDDAIMLDVPSVRIIHGKGTGVLREEIQKYLRTIPAVSSVRDEDVRAGGTGVTIVTF